LQKIDIDRIALKASKKAEQAGGTLHNVLKLCIGFICNNLVKFIIASVVFVIMFFIVFIVGDKLKNERK